VTEPLLFEPSAVIGPRTTLYVKREPGASRRWRTAPQVVATPLDLALGERLIRGLQALSARAPESGEPAPALR